MIAINLLGLRSYGDESTTKIGETNDTYSFWLPQTSNPHWRHAWIPGESYSHRAGSCHILHLGHGNEPLEETQSFSYWRVRDALLLHCRHFLRWTAMCWVHEPWSLRPVLPLTSGRGIWGWGDARRLATPRSTRMDRIPCTKNKQYYSVSKTETTRSPEIKTWKPHRLYRSSQYDCFPYDAIVDGKIERHCEAIMMAKCAQFSRDCTMQASCYSFGRRCSEACLSMLMWYTSCELSRLEVTVIELYSMVFTR